MKGVFFCYSPTLKRELMDIGERYVAEGKNDKTGRTYWMFLFNPRLTSYLDSRPKKKETKD